ncbi:MAG: UDP-N-acetylmuramoyl-tripeptide--D-alanyl-D-alanine ligase [Gordonia sp. (in: high G+C Gram-positive bacteria)]|uniref:UDP-N-acetylmuramoyl-tripeptide--D-alanyl-D- alanine ligase n=1 Tax=Gordonia sp. (in: high G+C Gram-positive bacteria) TaxID=84139 RepID=UPI0039E69056
MLTVVAAPDGATVDDARRLLRVMASAAADAGAGSMHRDGDTGARTWAIFGELAGGGDDENARCVEHDLLGRQAVRLAIDQVVAVGGGRPVRALHQGAVMEGSWGDEAEFAGSVDEYLARVAAAAGSDAAPRDGDVVLVAGGDGLAPSLLRHWRDEQSLDVVDGA